VSSDAGIAEDSTHAELSFPDRDALVVTVSINPLKEFPHV
jgi:hypothetical protein